jgi:hypothetical protein
MFSLVPVPGKGEGLMAMKNIKPGTLLISEPPALRVTLINGEMSSAASIDVSRQFSRYIYRIICFVQNYNFLFSMTPEERRKVIVLANNYDDENEILGIFKTNAMVIHPGESALFPAICRANHSCVPNCNYAWNSLHGQQALFCIAHIQAGEQLTISYLPDKVVDGVAERRKIILRNNNFVCMCESCSISPGMELTQEEYLRKVAKRRIGENGKQEHEF